jgi:hypothetical protein
MEENHDPRTGIDLKSIINYYLSETRYLRFYLITITIVLALSYSVFIFFNKDIISNLTEEDNLFEWLTAIAFLLASVFFLATFIKTRNLFFLIIAVTMFLCFGEEISWGQRIFGFITPENLKEINVQGEFNMHNISVFNSLDFQGNVKHGLIRLLDINILFKLATMLFGILLPFCVFHFRLFSSLAVKMKLPIPPLSIGIYFFLSWVFYRILRIYFIHDIEQQPSITEISEWLDAFILLMISLYFYTKRKIIIPGKDIKQFI